MDWWLWRVGQRKKIKNKTKQTKNKQTEKEIVAILNSVNEIF